VEPETTNEPGRSWRDSRWLILVEFVLVAAIYVGRQHHILKVSATPYLFLLGWISLRLRRMQWKQIGFTRYRTWTTTFRLGIACGVALELFDLLGKQRLLTRLLGKPPDLSGFPAVKGNLKFALLMIALIWILAAFGEELVYRGYLMNRVADLGRGSRVAWIVSLLVISASSVSVITTKASPVSLRRAQTADLGASLSCLPAQPGRSHCCAWSLRYNRHRPSFS